MITFENYLHRALENGLEAYLPKNQPPEIAIGFTEAIDNPDSPFHVLLVFTVLLLSRPEEGERAIEQLREKAMKREGFSGEELLKMIGLKSEYGETELEREHLSELISSYCFQLSIENLLRAKLVKKYSRAKLSDLFDFERRVSVQLTEKGKRKMKADMMWH